MGLLSSSIPEKTMTRADIRRRLLSEAETGYGPLKDSVLPFDSLGEVVPAVAHLVYTEPEKIDRIVLWRTLLTLLEAE